ncbi:ATP-dependent Clp protease ATP-binding subunit ClpC [Acetoanaerobium noterae]|uniref:ATP-dependent Clp protease ATP-binding subunit ClpC n=1 Tax=Acetoanaerobium noterae TaxID=745369 RepID=A0A1T5AQG3_9FIRM|nr:ATP-dependent Clp protease ATP-binding subunit [Acetoanaerobium noterae]SKB37218.1 ATP-dependent Clp protease ATP-binding subunit ClpC [Acetoanaerobium noterae]
MMENFTERAKQAIELAKREASKLGHNIAGSEHILLGLMAEGQGIAYQVLYKFGLTLESLVREIIDLEGIGLPNTHFQGFSPRTKGIFELSIMEAKMLGHSYIGTEHLLLALLKEKECIGCRLLMEKGIDYNLVFKEIINLLGGSSAGKEPNQAGNTSSMNSQNPNTPTLNQYGVDLTKEADENRLDPVIGRSKEIERIIQILSRRTKNNPVLIGDPGVGKTAIIEGLAQKINSGDIPSTLKNKRIMTLEMGTLLAGAKYRGEFEERVKKIVEELKANKDVIIFIDEIHNLAGAGGAEGAIDASNIMKPALARGEIQVMGATTIDEYRKHIEKDSALERRFQTVMVDEPNTEDSIKILHGLRDRYEAHHKVKITDEAIKAAVDLSHRYITDRFLPDKAIDLIDEAASRVMLRKYMEPDNIKELEDKLSKLSMEKEEAIATQDFEKAAKIRDEEKQIKEQLGENKEQWTKKNYTSTEVVLEKDIAEIVSSWTGVPVTRLQMEESTKLLDLENILHKRVIGQEEAVEAISRAIRRARTGLKDPKRPIGSFIFLGPTGVGKTELSKALAEAMFEDEDSIVRIDMSEYMEKHSVSKLIGSPPGYVGYDEGGQLTEKIRRKPYSVVLFDEIEKAHPDVFNMLLQILDDGRLTDSKGRTVDFKNTVLIMTSNVGATTIQKQKTLGFSTVTDEEKKEKAAYEKMKDNVMVELKRSFKPEFLNRVDDIIVFHALTDRELEKIVYLMISNLEKRLMDKNITIELDEAAMKLITKNGYDLEFGARPLKRAIQRLLEDEISEKLLRGEINDSDNIKVTAVDDKLDFVVKTKTV